MSKNYPPQFNSALKKKKMIKQKKAKIPNQASNYFHFALTISDQQTRNPQNTKHTNNLLPIT